MSEPITTNEGELWSLIRRVLDQGTAIQQDYAAGKYPTYEHLQARLDEAARERVPAFLAIYGVRAP